MKNTALIVDGMNVLFRGYYASPAQVQGADENGCFVAAVRGFINILLADIRRVDATHCAVVFDRPGKNFRHVLYPAYKAQRGTDGPNLRPSINPTRQMCNAMGVKVYGRKGVEGDDLIASLAVRASEKAKVFISSNDKDFAALVNKRISLLRPKGVMLDEVGVLSEYGVRPKQIVDYLTMLGDKVDNIPGINKVGPVTASKLLSQFSTLRNIYTCAKHTKAMQANFDEARPFIATARKLIMLDTSHYRDFKLADIQLGGIDPDQVDKLCSRFDFKTLRTTIYNTLGR